MAIVEAVLWDMDGVLLDSERLYQEAFIEIMDASGVMSDPKTRYLETIGMNSKSIVGWYLDFVDSEAQASHFCTLVGKRYQELAEHGLVLKPGVIEALAAVQEEGVQQMVVTSTRTTTALGKLERFDLMPYFSDVLGGDKVNNGKPNPEPYLTACASLGVHPCNALVIEDSVNGVNSGIDAGCLVVHVPDLISTKKSWNDIIYYAMDSLESFPMWFSKQRGGDWL